jgi:hypothetical protein
MKLYRQAAVGYRSLDIIYQQTKCHRWTAGSGLFKQYVKMVDQALNRMGEMELAWLLINF